MPICLDDVALKKETGFGNTLNKTVKSCVNSVNVYKNSLNCFFVNARSILNNLKLEELHIYANDYSLDVIGVAETWLNDKVLDAEVNIEGFTLFRKDRSHVSSAKGGGVLLYVRNTLVSRACVELNRCKSESVWCCITVENGTDIVIGVCYRSPNCLDKEAQELYSVIHRASEKQVLIMGDFNFPKINWDLLDADSQSSEFLNLVQDCFLFQHVRIPTRSDNILDLVFTSEEGMVDDVQVKEHLANSDHNIIVWRLICKTELNKDNKTLYNFNKADYTAMQSFLTTYDWVNLFDKLDVESMWLFFCNVLNDAVKKYVPVNLRKTNCMPKWMTKKTQKFTKYKSDMWARYRSSRTYNDYVEYKRTLNKATNVFRKAKLDFEKKLAKNIKTDPKSFYAYTSS